MHGPLWTADQGRTHVQLWAPNDRRDEWALGWTTTDEDGEVVDQQHIRRPHVGEFPALVPSDVQRPVGAVLNARNEDGGAWLTVEGADYVDGLLEPLARSDEHTPRGLSGGPDA